MCDRVKDIGHGPQMLDREHRVEHLPLFAVVFTECGKETGAKYQPVHSGHAFEFIDAKNKIIVHTLEKVPTLHICIGLLRQYDAKQSDQRQQVAPPKRI